MGVGGETSAAGELLVTSRADGDGVLHCAQAAGVEGTHVEDVDTIHLAENLETLQTSSLLEVRGDGTGLSPGAEEVILTLDLCSKSSVSLPILSCPIQPRQHTREGLVGANLLLGGPGNGGSLLVGALGGLACSTRSVTSSATSFFHPFLFRMSRTAHKRGGKGASGDARGDSGAASRSDGGALHEHCVRVRGGLA